jgi:hypothetical protein
VLLCLTPLTIDGRKSQDTRTCLSNAACTTDAYDNWQRYNMAAPSNLVVAASIPQHKAHRACYTQGNLLALTRAGSTQSGRP